jgi:hypothetical protein
MIGGRVQVVAFGALCAAGAATAVGLTVREVARTPAITVAVADTHRSGLTTSVDVAVRNTTGSPVCVIVRVAARDRTGRDLGTATTGPPLQLAPDSRRVVTAQVTVSAQDYAERLDRFYPSTQPCPAAERAT